MCVCVRVCVSLSSCFAQPVSGLFSLTLGKLDPSGLYFATEAWENSPEYTKVSEVRPPQHIVGAHCGCTL